MKPAQLHSMRAMYGELLIHGFEFRLRAVLMMGGSTKGKMRKNKKQSIFLNQVRWTVF